MGLHCRLHNQTLMEVAMPLVKKLSKGGELGDAMQAKVGGPGFEGWTQGRAQGSAARGVIQHAFWAVWGPWPAPFVALPGRSE